MTITTVNIFLSQINQIQTLLDLGCYYSRSEIIRIAVRDALIMELVPIEKSEKIKIEYKKEKKPITINISKFMFNRIQYLVGIGKYSSISEFIRKSIEYFIIRERILNIFDVEIQKDDKDDFTSEIEKRIIGVA
jgi:Arc/MetJ-type ribon-helix-helix transcriptional regulator